MRGVVVDVAVDTYEGAWNVHTMVVGKDITGHDALTR